MKNFMNILTDQILDKFGIKVVYCNDDQELTNYEHIPLNCMESTKQLEFNCPNPTMITLGSHKIAITPRSLLDNMMNKSIYYSKKFDKNFSCDEYKKRKIYESLKYYLASRNLYPIYGDDIKLDYGQLNDMDYVDFPNVCLLSSEQEESFVKKVNNTLFINFQNFLKNKSFGEYLILNLGSDEKNVRVEIYRS